MRLLSFIFIILFFCCSCNRAFYSVQKEYTHSFYDSLCDNSAVFVAPKFQVYGLDVNGIDSATFSANDPRDGNRIVYSVTFPVKNGENINRSPWDSINGIMQIGPATMLNRIAILQDSVTRFFCICDTLLPLSFNFAIQFKKGLVFTISEIVIKEMPVYHDSDNRHCAIYSYKVNDRRYFSQDFVIIMPGTRINMKPMFYIKRRGLFFNKWFSRNSYHEEVSASYHNKDLLINFYNK